MTRNDTAVATMQQQDGKIEVAGKLDVQGASELYRSGPKFASKEQILVDLSGVEELDSAGLALLVYWHQQAAAANTNLTLHGAGEQAENLIRISGLDSLLD